MQVTPARFPHEYDLPSLRTMLFVLIPVCLVLCLSITSQSLWIDEGVVVWLASESTFGTLLSSLRHYEYSEAQMPLYVFFMWFWVKLFGVSEAALRASNIPFVILLSSALAWTSWRWVQRRFLWIIFGVSPFLWFYMNEVRPYVAVVACAAVSFLALITYFANRERYGGTSPWICLLFLLIVCALHMMAVFLGVAMSAFAVMEMRRKHISRTQLMKDWKKATIFHLPFFLLLASYFCSTLLRGAHGAKGRPGLGNVVFALYEFLGFGGLGPPRNELRSEPHLATLIPYWPWLVLGVAACFGLILTAIPVFRSEEKRAGVINLVKSLLIGVILMVAASSVVGFQFWGRHLAPFFPLFIWIVILLFSAPHEDARFWLARPAALVVLVLAWTASDFRLRFLPKYGKDNYRLATEIALSETQRSGGTAVWIANEVAARYYGLQSVNDPVSAPWPIRGECIFAANWTPQQIDDFLAGAPGPLTIVISKADIFDQTGAWNDALRNTGARMIASANAFAIYQIDSGIRYRVPTVKSTYDSRTIESFSH